MKTRLGMLGFAGLLASVVGTTTAADCSEDACTLTAMPDALVHPDLLAQEEIAKRLLPLMPREHRDAIIAAGGIGSEGMTVSTQRRGVVRQMTAEQVIEQYVSPELAEKLTDIQWQIVNGIAEAIEERRPLPAMCFAPGTDPEYAFTINQMLELPFVIGFQQTGRWGSTATDGGGLGQGDPTTITYSFAPDGTFCPNIIGVTGNSNLQSWLNGIYGSQAVWEDLFAQVFDRWSELIGTTYVFEPNDDGSTLNNAAGVLGVRGDVRIAAIFIDGGSGTLAYNNFPNDGDMVFDSGDNFFNNTGGNSLRFRNVTAHEHGHGLGMLHVCPANQTKLMEPFVSTAYNGPQLDDILNGHRHYGDPMEPQSDDPFNPPDLGTYSTSGFINVQNVSIDDNSDSDFYQFTLTSPARVTFTASPDAGEYTQGGQTQACNGGTLTDYNSIHNLGLRMFELGSPFAPLDESDSSGIGETETLVFDAIDPGTYMVEVNGSTANGVQRYLLGGFIQDLPFLEPEIEAGPPSLVAPGVETNFAVIIDPRDDTLNGAPQLFYRFDGGSFSSTALTDLGSNNYTATLPAAACGENPQFYISAVGFSSGETTLPAGGASAPFSATVGTEVVIIEDDFESDLGWAVSGDVPNQAAGRWERGTPNGDGSRGDAPVDFDGSGQCWLTGNGGPGSNTDVDDGQTILNSPEFDATGLDNATVSYARWYDNTAGDNPGTKIFTVQISANSGISWTDLEVVGPNTENTGGWIEASHLISDFITPTSTMRVRFIAEDSDPGSVVEAAVDAFKVDSSSCEDPETCPADLAAPFGVLNFFDLGEFLTRFNAQDPSVDYAAPFGVFNFFDLGEYLTLFNQGCP